MSGVRARSSAPATSGEPAQPVAQRGKPSRAVRLRARRTFQRDRPGDPVGARTSTSAAVGSPDPAAVTNRLHIGMQTTGIRGPSPLPRA